MVVKVYKPHYIYKVFLEENAVGINPFRKVNFQGFAFCIKIVTDGNLKWL